MGKGKDDGKGKAARSKSQIKKDKEAQEWKQHVPAMGEFDTMEEWQRTYHRLADERVGRWRKITEVLDSPDPKAFTRVKGQVGLAIRFLPP